MRKNECVVTKQKVTGRTAKIKKAVSIICGASYLVVQGFTMTVFANGEAFYREFCMKEHCGRSYYGRYSVRFTFLDFGKCIVEAER